jgi:hypothetical protein
MISRLLRFALVFGLVSMFTAAGAWAQITINASDLRSEFIQDQTFTSMTYGVTDLIPVSPLVNNTDGPYDWTGLTFTEPDVFDVEIRTSFSGLPGAADFSIADGGFVCAGCGASRETSRIGAEDRGILEGFVRAAAGYESAGPSERPLDPRHATAHRRLLSRFIRLHVAEDRDLKALNFWESLPWRDTS